MADAALKLAVAGLAGLMLAEVPQVQSGFLPSPSTIYDKASGGIETGPESLHVLKVSAVKGSVIAVIMAASVSAMAYSVLGPKALWLFVLAMAVLALFLQDCWQAYKKGTEAAAGKGS